jgi:2-oxoisovalerate dehydrogenase E2 component (dihydrolipoyl transacylase)
MAIVGKVRISEIISTIVFSNSNGQPLVDIDVDDSLLSELDSVQDQGEAGGIENLSLVEMPPMSKPRQLTGNSEDDNQLNNRTHSPSNINSSYKEASLVTPAVRHLLKGNNIDIADLQGTGKDGRILKDDVLRHISTLSSKSTSSDETSLKEATADRLVALTPIETHMFNTMTRSLNIPHFLYTHAVDLTNFNNLRTKLNTAKTSESFFIDIDESCPRFTLLPFVMKALSLAFLQYPKLNSHLDMQTNPDKPHLLVKASHNFGVAIDTPQGLLVPVVKDVQNQSIASLAKEIYRLSSLARNGKLASADFKGSTFTISNIGSIGGNVVAPVIVEPMVGILGVGRARVTPAFEADENGVERIARRDEVIFSWSADHRIIDGATMAKCAKSVQELLENIELMGALLK